MNFFVRMFLLKQSWRIGAIRFSSAVSSAVNTNTNGHGNNLRCHEAVEVSIC